MAEQVFLVPGPSKAEFDSLSDQIGNIPKILKKQVTVTTSANGNAEISNQLNENYGDVIILGLRITSPASDLKAVPILYMSGGTKYIGIHVETTVMSPTAYTGSITLDVAYVKL